MPNYESVLNRSSCSLARSSTKPQYMYDSLGMIDEEEAMPLRPITRTQFIPGAATLFGSEEAHSEVQQSMLDEMNDTGIVELFYGLK